MSKINKLCVAMITGAHGVRGLVKLQSFTDPPQAISSYSPLYDEQGKPCEVEVLSPIKGQYLARVAGIEDRTKAEATKNARLYISRDSLPVANEGEFYQADLIGLTAEAADGGPIGRIVAVHNFGAGDILEVTRLHGGDFMIPFNRAFVPVVDLENRRVVLAPFEEVQ